MVMVQDFIRESSTALHFTSKCVTSYESKISGYVYLISPSKQYKVGDCYENYSKQASFKMRNCSCHMPLCYATGMTGMFPVGYEVATYIDDKNYMWVMPSRLTILSMRDKESALEFFTSYFDKPIQEMIIAASRTAFYMVMSIQLKQVAVASTKALMNLDLIIYTLFYAIRNELMCNDIFRAYCIPDNAWELLMKYDSIWSRNPGSWLSKFLAYDALHSDDPEIRERYTRVRLPLISSISVPFISHPQAININQGFVFYKTEPVGYLLLDDGDSFWLVKPLPEFLSGKALVPSESSQLLIMTEPYSRREYSWFGYLDELRTGRWRNINLHREFVIALDEILNNYLSF